MNVRTTPLTGVLIVEPRVFHDDRGCFFESYQSERYAAAGISAPFVQDNASRSTRGVVRGLHYQIERPQGKLVGVSQGAIFDVLVDLRRDSPSYGRWWSITLDDVTRHQVWIPPGLAHGFQVISDSADFHYKCTDYWFPKYERTIRWDDPDLAIPWPISDAIVSEKDACGSPFESAPKFGHAPSDSSSL